ncbi:cell division protein PerM [Actinomadura rupiterrae]|uniref:cell division protein PerM n=1 Tax=Actinomadura rupiterrae TaxID=559627 RepID=UPI0027E231F4|nr:DUF6350 family protein [Actinomadura rupiterrae]MCP2335495.1 hypothetical protein [Actinomadura rupiterrae]
MSETGRQRTATGAAAGSPAPPGSGASRSRPDAPPHAPDGRSAGPSGPGGRSSGPPESGGRSGGPSGPREPGGRSGGPSGPREPDGRSGGPSGPNEIPVTSAQRPLWVNGLVGAVWCIGIGLAVLTTITLAGWIAAPRTAFGHGLPGVFRTAVNFWLVSHHAGFSVDHGRVGLLPLGVLLIPGFLLYRSGGWMIRRGLPRDAVRHPAAAGGADARRAVLGAAVALAAPYAALAGLLALAAASPVAKPSPWQAVVACFTVAAVSGGMGAARTVVAARGRRVRSGLGALLRLLPERPRSLVVGVAGSVSVLLGGGAVLVGASLAMHTGEAARQYDLLAPGIVGGVLLVLVQVAFLPNAVIWGMAYAIGPGFAVGAGTSVSANGVILDVVPVFPPLAALPQPGPAPVPSLLALAVPFLAGAVGGVLTVRAMPSTVSESAPLWGFASGALTGLVTAVLAALSGGPLGGERMATVGPSAWQVGLLAALEVGISAAIAAWLANWRILRRAAAPDALPPEPAAEARTETVRRDAPEPATGEDRRRRPDTPAPSRPAPSRPVPGRSAPEAPPSPAAPEPSASPYASDPLEFEEAEPVLAPRRPARSKTRYEDELPDLMDDPAPPPEPEPAPAPEPPPAPVVEHTPEPEITPEPDETDVPRPRPDEPERTENRGGAIYVLRDDPRDDA